MVYSFIYIYIYISPYKTNKKNMASYQRLHLGLFKTPSRKKQNTVLCPAISIELLQLVYHRGALCFSGNDSYTWPILGMMTYPTLGKGTSSSKIPLIAKQQLLVPNASLYLIIKISTTFDRPPLQNFAVLLFKTELI